MRIDYHDPFVPEIRNLRNHDLSMRSIDINKKKIKNFDVVIIVTDHDVFNYEFFRIHSKLLVDTRGIFKKKYPNIISA